MTDFHDYTKLDNTLIYLVKTKKLRCKYQNSKRLKVYKAHQSLHGQAYFDPIYTKEAMYNITTNYIKRLGKKAELLGRFAFERWAIDALINPRIFPNNNFTFDLYVPDFNGHTLYFEFKNWGSDVPIGEVWKFINKFEENGMDIRKEKTFFVSTKVSENAAALLKEYNITLICIKKQIVSFRCRKIYEGIFKAVKLTCKIPKASNSKDKLAHGGHYYISFILILLRKFEYCSTYNLSLPQKIGCFG